MGSYSCRHSQMDGTSYVYWYTPHTNHGAHTTQRYIYTSAYNLCDYHALQFCSYLLAQGWRRNQQNSFPRHSAVQQKLADFPKVRLKRFQRNVLFWVQFPQARVVCPQQHGHGVDWSGGGEYLGKDPLNPGRVVARVASIQDVQSSLKPICYLRSPPADIKRALRDGIAQ